MGRGNLIITAGRLRKQNQFASQLQEFDPVVFPRFVCQCTEKGVQVDVYDMQVSPIQEETDSGFLASPCARRYYPDVLGNIFYEKNNLRKQEGVIE